MNREERAARPAAIADPPTTWPAARLNIPTERT
jgi:hypothetical protein